MDMPFSVHADSMKIICFLYCFHFSVSLFSCSVDIAFSWLFIRRLLNSTSFGCVGKYDALCVVNNMHGAVISAGLKWNHHEAMEWDAHTHTQTPHWRRSIWLFKFISMRIFDLICSVFGQKFNKFYLAFVFVLCVVFGMTFFSLSLIIPAFLIAHRKRIESMREREWETLAPNSCRCRSSIEQAILRHHTILFIWFFSLLFAFYYSWFKFYYHPSFDSQISILSRFFFRSLAICRKFWMDARNKLFFSLYLSFGEWLWLAWFEMGLVCVCLFSSLRFYYFGNKINMQFFRCTFPKHGHLHSNIHHPFFVSTNNNKSKKNNCSAKTTA